MAKGGKTEKWTARGERLSAALRENLKRRKAQGRERELARRGRDEDSSAPGAGSNAPGPDFGRNRGVHS